MPNILRVTFEKGFNMRYTGHLDILRTFVRGLRRADMPLKYSEGFNPHAVMTFLLPLGVGTTSECEMVDIALEKEISAEEFTKKVNDSMPKDGIKILSAFYTEEKMPTVKQAEYSIKIENDKPIDVKKLNSVLSGVPIIVEKKSKRQMKEVDISEHIFSHNITVEDEKTFVLDICLSAGNTFNVKPQLLIEGIKSVCPDFNPVLVLPHRKKFIFEN